MIHFLNPYYKTNNLKSFSEKSEHVSIFDPRRTFKANDSHLANATICGISIMLLISRVDTEVTLKSRIVAMV